MISASDLEQLAEIELQKEEEDQGQLCPLAPPSGNACQDASHPYYDVARHGILQVTGDDNYGRKLIIFSSCCMPPSHQLNHHRLLEYMKYTLDQYVESDYTVVYFHYGLRSINKPSLSWLRNAYREFDRKYKKNLKALYVVHPTNFIRILWNLFKPLISHKFGKKLTYVNYLAELREHVNYEQLIIPHAVLRIIVETNFLTKIWTLFCKFRAHTPDGNFIRLPFPPYKHDEELRAAQKGGPALPAKAPPPRPPLPTQQFGVSLQYIRDRHNGVLIPPVMSQTVSYLKRKGLKTEGIFRRSVRVQLIKDIQKLYNQGKPVSFEQYSDVHVPAVILKTFLRELPEPLLTFTLYNHIQDLTKVESSLRVSRCKTIVGSLPEYNLIVVKYLICFLNMVSQESIFNKMSSSNLACVFGVNLAWPRHGGVSLSAITPLNMFTELLIEHYEAIFSSHCPPQQVLP